ncbi:OmpA family protein [uncultured Roseovarius sp.]|uniref:OmpA family protein n=1 Tax=uncultured Roseovarius sp. TaxID=293344 RepID=UPI002635F0E2|nr:OmpA family protein [uncultured Roseovarius sp.]
MPIALAMCLAVMGQAHALELQLPGNAIQTGEAVRDPDSYLLPVAPFENGNVPVIEVEGRVSQQTWRIAQTGLTTLQMIRPLRDQLVQAGYEIILDCGGQQCGGFDFRFNTRVSPAPEMYVDLFDFRFLSARMPGSGASDMKNVVSVICSQADDAGYVQIIQVTAEPGAATPAVRVDDPAPIKTENDPVPVIRSLTEQGHVILEDLDFATGSSTLGPGPHASLVALAEYLLADGKRRIALVGHTDRMGSLESNVALSRRRATSVMDRLVADHGVRRVQLEANGVGYLSPIAPNTTREGREANRRVEAVLLNDK